MKQSTLLLVLLFIFLSGCVPNMTPDKTVLSSFKIGNATVEHFNHSSAYAETPDYITITKGNIVDTICVATNIATVTKNSGNVINIGFYGIPKLYTKTIQLPKGVLEYTIAVDTTYKKKLH
ncbi:hypothetical protein [Flavobacterium quisquiliarum]|nr:hypothetical protein [Flavobacterium quisquiliarum]MBW1655363.1 hypothetical protein [Flavobacterium quisquiliarum]